MLVQYNCGVLYDHVLYSASLSGLNASCVQSLKAIDVNIRTSCIHAGTTLYVVYMDCHAVLAALCHVSPVHAYSFGRT